jgi:hypothetical protein
MSTFQTAATRNEAAVARLRNRTAIHGTSATFWRRRRNATLDGAESAPVIIARFQIYSPKVNSGAPKKITCFAKSGTRTIKLRNLSLAFLLGLSMIPLFDLELPFWTILQQDKMTCSLYPFAWEFQESGRWRDPNLFGYGRRIRWNIRSTLS